MEERKAKCICIIGTNGTGKSTLAVQLMQQQRSGLMILPTFDDWAAQFPQTNCSGRADLSYDGIRHHVMDSDSKVIFSKIFQYYRDGIIVCDDPIVYIPKNLDDHPLKNILARRRQISCDIVFVAHTFKRVPPMLFDYITEFIIFNTVNASSRKNELGANYEIIEKIIKRVAYKAKTDAHYCEIFKTGL